MKQITCIVWLVCGSICSLFAQQPDETDKKTLEREVKISGNYLYGEAIAPTKDEAVQAATNVLVSEINREALNHHDWPFAQTLQAKELEDYAETIDFMRGDKFRVIAYIPKNDLTALFDNKRTQAESSDPTTPPEETENAQSTPVTTATTPQPPQTVIKMEKNRDGTYLIPCKVNGLNLKLLYDTGASDVSISLFEANFMLRNGYLSESDFMGTKQYTIANGDVIDGTKTILKTIEIGDLKLYDIEASIIHTADAPLLLGQSALSKLGKIEFDYTQGLLIIKGESAVTQTTPAVPVSAPPVEEVAPVIDPQPAVALTTPATPGSVPSVEEAAPVIDPQPAVALTTPATPGSVPPVEEATPVIDPPPAAEQTASADPVISPPVEEATPVIDLQPVVEQTHPGTQPTVASGDLLGQIVKAPSMYELKNILIAGKKKGKLVYGRMDKILNEKMKYLIVYKPSGEIVAILDKGADSRRNDLRSGKTMGQEIFGNHPVIWVQFF